MFIAQACCQVTFFGSILLDIIKRFSFISFLRANSCYGQTKQGIRGNCHKDQLGFQEKNFQKPIKLAYFSTKCTIYLLS